MSEHSNRRRLRPLFALLGVVAMLLAVLGLTSPARAESVAESYVVSGEVAPDGTLTVKETLTFAAAPTQIVQRLEKSIPTLDYSNYLFQIDNVTATADGNDLGPQVSDDGNYKVIKVDGAKAGTRPIEISYTVKGAALAGEPSNEGTRLTQIRWRVLQGLNVGVKQVRGQISTGQAVVQDVNCQAGAPTSLVSCGTVAASTFESRYPTFTNGALGTGQVVLLEFKVKESDIKANQQIQQLWTLDRAFSADTPQLLTALAVAVVGSVLLWLLFRSRGRDGFARASLVGNFEPIADGQTRFTLHEGVRPGEVGTIADEHVDPIDVSATILDLAQRGHLRIVEQERASAHAPLDWTLERTSGTDEPETYETALLDALVPADGEPLQVSKISSRMGESIHKIQDGIYDAVVSNGWFTSRPDRVRGTYSRLGIAALVVAVVALGLLVAFTHFGLLGLVLVGLGVGCIFVAQQMPRRSQQGSAVYQGLQALAIQLQTQPTNQSPKGQEYEEISRILPYAVVLGAQDRWLQALADADNDPGVPDPDDLNWYHAPATWNLSDLPASIDAFITTVEGKLYSRG